MNEGEQVFIYGPSGSGKTTFLNILSGLIRVDDGKVNVFGYQLDEMSGRSRDAYRANCVGHVFQTFNLIPYLTAIENIQLAGHFSQKWHGKELLREAKQTLADLRVPETHYDMQTRNLSMGQQQRVAIARALINKPKLLIADEPTSSLDKKNKEYFMSMIMELVETNGITLLMVSHDPSLSDYFERVEEFNDINVR